MVSAHFNTAYCAHTNTSETATRTPSELGSSCPPEIPRLTYDEEDSDISSNQHALVFPSFMGPGNRSHSVPSPAPSVSSQPRSMVPEKDIALYGYGSVAWKERMEEWKKRQGDNLQVANHQGSSSGWDLDGELDDVDLPM
ncbi:hypothetical protein CsSME_00002316 [Camellia sinensis var. sinensis]